MRRIVFPLFSLLMTLGSGRLAEAKDGTGAPLELAGVPKGYGVFAEGETIEELAEQTHPTLQCDGLFLWIDKQPDGSRRFSMARPYGVGALGHPVRAVLLEVLDPKAIEKAYAARTTATLDRTINANKLPAGAGIEKPYATVLSMDPQQGTLYQLGFPFLGYDEPREMRELRLLVMHDPKNGWRHVATPWISPELLAHAGGAKETLTTRVTWKGDSQSRLDFSMSRTITGANGKPLTTSADAVLLYGQSDRLTSFSRPYYTMQAGDTIWDVAKRFVPQANHTDAAASRLASAITGLNGNIKPENFAPGMHLTIPAYKEIEQLISGKITAKQVQPLPNFDVETLTADTSEGAAMLAMILMSGNEFELDVSRTTEELRKQMADKEKNHYTYKVDLNGDGKPEYVYDASAWVDRAGELHNEAGATGNHPFAIITQEKNGKYRIVYYGWGTGPYTRTERKNGWLDIEIGWHMSAMERTVEYFRYDGNMYRSEWGAQTVGGEGQVSFVPTAAPDNLVQQAAWALKQKNAIANAAFEAEVDGQKFLLLSIESKAFIYWHEKTGWGLVAIIPHHGPIWFPEWDSKKKELIFSPNMCEDPKNPPKTDFHVKIGG